MQTNLEDLQAGVEACSRAANKIDVDAAKSNGLLKSPLHRSLLDHVKDLLTCVRDQRAVVQELRRSLIELRHEETARRAVHRPANVSTGTLPSR